MQCNLIVVYQFVFIGIITTNSTVFVCVLFLFKYPLDIHLQLFISPQNFHQLNTKHAQKKSMP